MQTTAVAAEDSTEPERLVDRNSSPQTKIKPLSKGFRKGAEGFLVVSTGRLTIAGAQISTPNAPTGRARVPAFRRDVCHAPLSPAAAVTLISRFVSSSHAAPRTWLAGEELKHHRGDEIKVAKLGRGGGDRITDRICQLK